MEQPSSYFSSDYFAARSRFRQVVEKAGGRLEVLVLEAKGPDNEKLTIDIAWLGAEKPRRVLLHSSGLHGVEGFAGSAIQLQLLDNLPTIPDDAALLLAHILNPYGMAWLRRVNENNVDLNRNCLGDKEYAGAPEKYPQLDSFLNPQSPPGRDFFLLKAVWLMCRHGYNSVKQAIAGGQYEYPKGLFFGGKRLEQGPAKYQSFIAQCLSSAEKVIGIDVHTGLGKYGEDTLLIEDKDYNSLRQFFGSRVEPLKPEKGMAYEASGWVGPMIPRILPKAQVSFVAQEIGTHSGIKVLYAMREENRWFHYGDGTLAHSTKQNLKEAFDPNDDTWRLSVLRRGQELLNHAVRIAF